MTGSDFVGDPIEAIAAKLDRLDAALDADDAVRPLRLHIAIEAGRDALAIISGLQRELADGEEELARLMAEWSKEAEPIHAQLGAVTFAAWDASATAAEALDRIRRIIGHPFVPTWPETPMPWESP